MNNLQIFSNTEFGELKVIYEDRNVLFPASECATILGYTNPHKAIADHCRLDGLTKREVIDSLGRTQLMSYITEGNLYRLIARSKLPSAIKFESWVYDEVLPNLRKHGMYAKDELLDNPDLLLDVITKLKDERIKRQLLETKMVTLETTNEILVTEQLHWADSKIINAIVRRVGNVIGYDNAWREFKKEMLYKHGININARQEGYFKQHGKKQKSTLDVLDKEELSLAVKVALAICSVNKCKVDDLLQKISIV